MHSVQVRGNLRQPQWAIKQMGNLVMPIKSGGREGKNREMKQNVILIRTTWLPSPSSSPMGQHHHHTSTYSHYHHHEDIFCGCSVGVNFAKKFNTNTNKIAKPCVVEGVNITLCSSGHTLGSRPEQHHCLNV